MPLGKLTCNPHIQGQLHCIAQASAAAGEGQGQLSDLMIPGLDLPPTARWKGEDISLPHPCHCTKEEWQSHLSVHICLGWLTCNSLNVQGLLSQIL